MVGFGRLRRRACSVWCASLCWVSHPLCLRCAGIRRARLRVHDRRPLSTSPQDQSRIHRQAPGELPWHGLHCRCGRPREIPAWHPHFPQGNADPHPKLTPRHPCVVWRLGHTRLEAARLDATPAKFIPRRPRHRRYPCTLPRERRVETPTPNG